MDFFSDLLKISTDKLFGFPEKYCEAGADGSILVPTSFYRYETVSCGRVVNVTL